MTHLGLSESHTEPSQTQGGKKSQVGAGRGGPLCFGNLKVPPDPRWTFWPRWERQGQASVHGGSREQGWGCHSIREGPVDLSLPAPANSPGSEEGVEASARLVGVGSDREGSDVTRQGCIDLLRKAAY